MCHLDELPHHGGIAGDEDCPGALLILHHEGPGVRPYVDPWREASQCREKLDVLA